MAPLGANIIKDVLGGRGWKGYSPRTLFVIFNGQLRLERGTEGNARITNGIK